MKKIYILFTLSLLLLGCSDYYDTDNNPITYGKSHLDVEFATDKARYLPGESVNFTLKTELPANVMVRYSHLGEVLAEEALTAQKWSWRLPQEDYRGYMVELLVEKNGEEKIVANIAVDASSDWAKFPRYGFLSSYGKKSQREMESTIGQLNRYHITGVQFYDWLHDHQKPLAGSVEQPADSWSDLIGRTNYRSTVEGYIEAIHSHNMKAMFYNLAFGALENAAIDGVKEEWYLFKDKEHQEKDKHHLDAPFRSSIYLTNAANSEWQEYVAKRNKEVYAVYDFDGFHIDQLGNRGTLYDYHGNAVEMENTYKPFIDAMKESEPDKYLLMNAVSEYAIEKIADTDVSFFYNEVWGERKSFDDLSQLLIKNHNIGGGAKNTVLAAYINYARSNRVGEVNTPGVLYANSVIFAFGGAHLELGEHYLVNEYFPNTNLQPTIELKRALIGYYDFMVAYQNLLRDGGEFKTIGVSSVDNKLSINQWPASQGEVAVVGKRVAGRDVVHLINFSDANSMEWRDTNATQVEPNKVEEPSILIEVEGTPTKVWVASPDIDGGVAKELSFELKGGKVSVTLPSLKYWSMVVVEY